MKRFTERAVRTAVEKGLVNEDQPLVALVDVTGVRGTIGRLHAAFPEHFQHAFAAKANPMSSCLRLVRSAGMGCEVASRGELAQALACGFEPSEIVYDEPAKLPGVLREVLDTGVALNIDNFQEFERVKHIVREKPAQSRIGFRINPQVGAGTIGAMSTATLSSKFGVPLEDEGNRERLLSLYGSHCWLTSLHSHVGSQGVPLEKMVAGVRKVVDLAEEINAQNDRRQVELVDIGGGLPVNFDSDEEKPGFAEYADRLRDGVPELFSGDYRVKTEFGRSILAKNGLMVSRVEYTKIAGGRRIVTTHAGGQVATRTVFMPESWPIRVAVFGPDGKSKQGEPVSQDFAGPLCFSGDMIATGRILPQAEPGDLVALLDTGAYYFSNPFFYNVLPACPVYGLEIAEEQGTSVDCWRGPQSLEQVLSVIG